MGILVKKKYPMPTAAEQLPGETGEGLRGARFWAAFLLGLFGAAIIWLLAPYHNVILAGGYIADDYNAPAVLLVLFFMVLVAGPLLGKLHPALNLSYPQRALILIMLLAGATLSSSGLLRFLPYSLAHEGYTVSYSRYDEDALATANLPPALFPIAMEYAPPDAEVVRDFKTQLPQGRPVPWRAWLRPSFAWLGLMFPFWLMSIGLAGVCYRQWRDMQRMQFPLMKIQREFIAPAPHGRSLPAIFYEPWLWAGAAAVFAIHLVNGSHVYFPLMVPEIPLRWNLASLFADPPWSYLPGFLKEGQIFFIFIGVAYFMSNRAGFSIWFFMFAQGLYATAGQIYAPPFNWTEPIDHRIGAMIVVSASVILLGWRHWVQIIHSLLLRPWRPIDDPQLARDCWFAFLMLLGLLGMFAWQLWAGTQPLWALVNILLALMYCLTLCRVFAETGIPLFGIFAHPFGHVLSLAPVRWIAPATAWVTGAFAGMIGETSRMSVAVMSTHILSLDPSQRPQAQMRLSRLIVLLLLLSFFFCGAAHLYFAYHHSYNMASLPGPLEPRGSIYLSEARLFVEDVQKDAWTQRPTTYSRPAHIAFGAAASLVLQWLCIRVPWWPLHPMGFIVAWSFYAFQLQFSVLIGWLMRTALVFFGGSRLYAKGRTFFLGLILGEVLAGLFWLLITLLLVALGESPRPIGLFPYR